MQLFFVFDNRQSDGEGGKQQLTSRFATELGEVELSEISASALGKAIQIAVRLNTDISGTR